MNQPIRLRSIRRSEWTKEMDAMLEVCSDREVARKLGVAMSSIRQRRRTIGVVSNKTSKPTQPPHWTAKADRRLGTMPDSALARELGTTKYHVRTRRLQLGIPAFVPPDVPPAVLEKPKALKLTERQLALLGTTFDTTLAKRWGVTAGTVTRLRQKLDIEAFRPVQDIEWTRGMLDLLGEVSDAELAREYELSRNTVKIKRIELGIFPYRKRRMDPEPDLPRRVTELLGKIPDKQISDRYKVNRFKLRVYRALHKIPAAEYAPPPLHRWSSQDDALLGTMSDAAVARKLGIPPPQVHHRRRLKKIPAFNRKAAVKWTAERLAQLGKQSDQRLSILWRYPQSQIREKRESLGIKPCKQRQRAWTKSELQMLGKRPDPELAKQWCVSATLVRSKRQELGIAPFKPAVPFKWKKKDVQRLGKVFDDELALELGVSHQFVAMKRVSLGIPARRRSADRWTPQVIKKLGKMSDRQLARELRCSAGLVLLKRKELGIPAFTDKK